MSVSVNSVCCLEAFAHRVITQRCKGLKAKFPSFKEEVLRLKDEVYALMEKHAQHAFQAQCALQHRCLLTDVAICGHRLLTMCCKSWKPTYPSARQEVARVRKWCMLC